MIIFAKIRISVSYKDSILQNVHPAEFVQAFLIPFFGHRFNYEGGNLLVHVVGALLDNGLFLCLGVRNPVQKGGSFIRIINPPFPDGIFLYTEFFRTGMLCS